MAKGKEARGIIKLKSEASDHCYFTQKNRNNSKEFPPPAAIDRLGGAVEELERTSNAVAVLPLLFIGHLWASALLLP